MGDGVGLCRIAPTSSDAPLTIHVVIVRLMTQLNAATSTEPPPSSSIELDDVDVRAPCTIRIDMITVKNDPEAAATIAWNGLIERPDIRGSSR